MKLKLRDALQVIALAVLGGVPGLALLWKDIGGSFETAVPTAVLYLLPAALIGFLLPRMWPVTVLVSWTALAFWFFSGLFWVFGLGVATHVIVEEGRLSADPSLVPGLTVEFNVRNGGYRVHEVGMVKISEDDDLGEVAQLIDTEDIRGRRRSDPTNWSLRSHFPADAKLEPGEVTKGWFEIGEGRYAAVCFVKGHAAAGEIAEVRLRKRIVRGSFVILLPFVALLGGGLGAAARHQWKPTRGRQKSA